MDSRQTVDLIIRNSAAVLTLAGPRPRRGRAMSDTAAIAHGAVAVQGETIAAVDREEEILRRFSSAKVLDAGGRLILPGFVDPHTHLVFAGSRADEFQRRLAGESYLDILKSGGGIHATVRAVRAADEESLFCRASARLDRLLAHGTTAVEIKSGYGLDTESELKMLRVIRRLQQSHVLDIEASFLAHVVPPDRERKEYIQWLCTQALVIARSYARFFDVFCETEAFSRKETELLLRAAQNSGFEVKVHAGQFHSLGVVSSAVDLHAVSVDHCDHLEEHEIESLSRGNTVAVLLPGTVFHTGDSAYADGGRLIDRGVPVALASDFNPGTSPCFSMPMMIALACRKMNLTPQQAIAAATVNAACALGRDRIGSLEAGQQSDLVILDIEKPEELPYYFGVNLVYRTVKRGRVFDAAGNEVL